MSHAEKWQRLAEKWEASEKPKTGTGSANLKTCTACVKQCEALLSATKEVAAWVGNCRKVMEQAMRERADLDAQMADRLVKLGRQQRITAALELTGMAIVIIVFVYCVVSW